MQVVYLKVIPGRKGAGLGEESARGKANKKVCMEMAPLQDYRQLIGADPFTELYEVHLKTVQLDDRRTKYLYVCPIPY